MRTRDQIISENLELYKREHLDYNSGKEELYKTLAQEHGQTYVDELQVGARNYPRVIKTELEKRLTEEAYLTCDDFDHFDIKCCKTCHDFYPHYDMWIVVLSDGRHAWVCDPIRSILMRRTKSVPRSLEEEEKLKLLGQIFKSEPDPIEDALHEASIAAKTDEERLFYCVKYAHHHHGRKRGHKAVETLVHRALRLPGRGPAKSSAIA